MSEGNPTVSKDSIDTVVKWLLGQPFTNLLLIAMLSGGGWTVWYGLTIAIPSHLQALQMGYDRNSDADAKQRAEDRATHQAERKEDRDLMREILQMRKASTTTTGLNP